MGNKKNEVPEQVTLTPEQTEALENRLRHNELTDKDTELLLQVLRFSRWLQNQLAQAKLSIQRLKKIFGFNRESTKKQQGKTDENNDSSSTDEEPPDLADDEASAPNPPDNNTEPDGESDVTTKNQSTDLKQWDPEQNHGRLSAHDYTGCQDISVPFTDEQLRQGKCPDCHTCETDAKLYPINPSVVVLLDSQPLITGERYHLQRARCTVCQAYFAATLPKEAEVRSKYSPSVSTSLAIHHYQGGLPFKRIETLQALQGVPLPDSTQFDLMSRLYENVGAPLMGALRECAANGNNLFFDDTHGRIVEQIIDNRHAQLSKKKKAVHATALISEYQGHHIYLFDTNTQTAGKQLAQLLAQRTLDETFTTMSDASASNFPWLDDTLMARWLICLCLAHGRRRFFELLDAAVDGKCDRTQEDSLFVIKLVAHVYANERHCKQQRFDAQQRLQHHQQYSAPIMEALRVWLNNLLLYRLVEPNSRFGEAVTYLLKRWEWLTQFLRVPGTPLDNNLCERAIKIAIRYRNNSLFYRTFFGASIGDAMMSLLHTAANAQVNVFHYLNTLQQHVAQVQEQPHQWLPWNYQDTLSQFAQRGVDPPKLVVNAN